MKKLNFKIVALAVILFLLAAAAYSYVIKSDKKQNFDSQDALEQETLPGSRLKELPALKDQR